MKKIIFLISIVFALCGCAVTPDNNQYELLKYAFDSWAMLQKQKEIEQGSTAGIWKKSELGTYIITDNEPSEGELVGDMDNAPMVLVEYRSTDFDGTILETSYASDAKRLGTYDPVSYYGPTVWDRTGMTQAVLLAGLDESVSTMRVGGLKKTAIPSWLATLGRYKTEDEYLRNKKNYLTYSDVIYTVHLVDIIKDVEKWQQDSVESYCNKHYPGLDSLTYGLYYNQERAGTPVTRQNGDTLKISYTGRLLNGNVFDTNIKDSAMVHNLYNENTNYVPMSIIWDEDVENITIANNNATLTDGFSYVVQKMSPGEKGTVVFISSLGYGTAKQGSRIPSYSPLSFTIEMIK